MKHFYFTLFLGIFMSMIGHHLYAHDIEVANSEGKTIYYYINNDGYSLSVIYQGTSPSSYSNEYTGEIVIPETVTYSGKTYPVTRISPCAFEGCSNMTSLTIPNSITSIENYAFRGCSGLISITFPNFNNTIDIASDAFLEETAWYNNKPNGLVYAGNVAYKYKGTMPDNTSITLKNGTIGIASEAFDGCGGLTSVSIPNSVVSIGADAFLGTAWYNNKPDGLVYAGNVAYKYKGTMPDNTSITLRDGTVGIASKAFSGCSGLTSVTIPNSVTSIGDLAFSGCKGLASVSIPDNVTNISHGAFRNCSNITSIIIPNSITRLNEDVFSECYGLTSVIIPNSVTIIVREAFQDCYNLTSVNIPNSVISIGFEAFENCSGLTSLIIPNSVTYIDRTAFRGCKKLSSLYCLWENPIPINSTVFSDETFQTCTLYVPKGTKEKYQNTEAWKSFSVINEFDPLEIENKEVNVILSSAGYATFYNTYNNFKIPVGLSAQVVTFDSYGNLSYNTIANGIIPKGVPVILKSNNKRGGTYTLTSTTESATYSGENLLHGSSSQTMTSNVNGVSTSGNSSYVYYKLAYGKSGSVNANKFGWYWGANNGAAFSIEGGKAWLALPITNAQSKRAVLFIDDDMSIDDATSIDNIEQSCNNEANSIQYNMAGQRVDNSYNGIIIVNGKKIVR